MKVERNRCFTCSLLNKKNLIFVRKIVELEIKCYSKIDFDEEGN